MPSLFADEYKYSTAAADTQMFVDVANAHIDAMYKKNRRVGEAFFHSLAVFLSELNTQQGNGGPFGAIIVEYEGGLDGQGQGIGKPHVIGLGANHVVPHNDPSAHAEMEAYRDAAKRKGSSDLHGAVLYTSCECCPMCLSVANGSGISRISYVNTRAQAESIDFSDKLQYEMFSLPRDRQMTSIQSLNEPKRKALLEKLGKHGAVVLDDKDAVFAFGDTDTSKDPTGIASINAVRAAVKKYAQQQAAAGNKEPVFCVPDDFTLVSHDIPHPAGLITADWARILRKRDKQHPNVPAYDDKVPDPTRIIHVTDEYEQMPVFDAQGHEHIRQNAAVTYQQPNLPDAQRAVPTQHYEGRLVPGAAQRVFDDWKRDIGGGMQVAY